MGIAADAATTLAPVLRDKLTNGIELLSPAVAVIDQDCLAVLVPEPPERSLPKVDGRASTIVPNRELPISPLVGKVEHTDGLSKLQLRKLVVRRHEELGRLQVSLAGQHPLAHQDGHVMLLRSSRSVPHKRYRVLHRHSIMLSVEMSIC